tara:strand:+ start:562 stop:921 length:360 start_codon:yes stop_codon:yes gene_type:complete
MPSQRKRIGFLPRSEVQKIIDQICKVNKLSQSKVTGILVEEALSSRGAFTSSNEENLLKIDCNQTNSSSNSEKNLNNNMKKNINLDDFSIKEEVQMINDFIEFKFFKEIMSKNRKKDSQ